MLSDFIKRLLLATDLDEGDMTAAIGEIMDGKATPAQIAGFLIALRCKGETIDEITGAARAMRARMIALQPTRQPLLDTCGTGGDRAGTFNISTAVAFVAAAGGAAVAKHGNRAVSSRSGSADVLAALGVRLEAPPEVAAACIDTLGIGFLFAPNHHPAMKHAAAVRRELGVRTIFNILGPLTNPAGAHRQLLGVYDATLTARLTQVLGRLGSQRAWVVHGEDGCDELSVCAATRVAQWTGTEVIETTLQPEDVGLPRHHAEGLRGGTAEENARTMREVLGGRRPGPLQDAVALNAGAALLLADRAATLTEGVAQAQRLLGEGAPLRILEALIERTTRDQ